MSQHIASTHRLYFQGMSRDIAPRPRPYFYPIILLHTPSLWVVFFSLASHGSSSSCANRSSGLPLVICIRYSNPSSFNLKFKLDDRSSGLVWIPSFLKCCQVQCRKLVHISNDMQTWMASKYFLRFCTDHSLEHIQRYWVLYLEMETIRCEHTT